MFSGAIPHQGSDFFGAIGQEARTMHPHSSSTETHRARDNGLLIGKGGLWGQTIRFAPPMCITQADADFLLAVFDEAFSSL